jgi:hypothetical protein
MADGTPQATVGIVRTITYARKEGANADDARSAIGDVLLENGTSAYSPISLCTPVEEMEACARVLCV